GRRGWDRPGRPGRTRSCAGCRRRRWHGGRGGRCRRPTAGGASCGCPTAGGGGKGRRRGRRSGSARSWPCGLREPAGFQLEGRQLLPPLLDRDRGRRLGLVAVPTLQLVALPEGRDGVVARRPRDRHVVLAGGRAVPLDEGGEDEFPLVV